ncbi:MAG: hypothetical protein ABIQ31_03790 [Ferruginibacter sp.]
MQDFEEILKVAYNYNNFNVTQDFPSRGCIVYGDISFKPFDSENLRGGRYMLNMIYGKALIDAHLKAEAMSWAGCELDISSINYARTLGDINPLLQKYTLLYDIPFKSQDGEIKQQGHALRLFSGRILITQHYEEGIKMAFTQDNKGAVEGRTKVIFDNTIEFLKAHQVKFPFFYQMNELKADNTEIQIFGKLAEDYTHTIVRSISQEQQNYKYELEVIAFDRNESDRDFLNAGIISPEIFEEQLQKAKSQN